jgi:hypothetical protein
MAASGFVLYNTAKRYIADGTIDIDGAAWRMALFTSASNAGALTLSAKAQITNEVAEQFGYSSSGKALVNIKWQQGRSAGEMMFTSDQFFWSANAGDILSVKWAVIFDPGTGKALARSQLSAAQFNVTAGNRLTITPAATGYFYLHTLLPPLFAVASVLGLLFSGGPLAI